MKLNKKVIGLLMASVMSLSIVGCGKYKDKCNPEYCMLGQTMIGSEGYGTTLNERVETILLETNKDEEYKVILNIDNVGDTFEYNDKIYRYTISSFEYSKGINDDNQFSDAQYGVLVGLYWDIKEEYDEFVESESTKKYISDDLYNESIEMYEDYMNVIYEITKNYNGELNEKELPKLDHYKKHYKTIKNKVVEKMAGEFIDDIFSNLFN